MNSKVNNNNTLTKKDKKMNTIELTKEEFLNKVANYKESPNEWKYLGDKPAIIDFYASWCGPCKMLSPILDEIAGEYKDSIIVYKVNTEKEQELAAVFGIKSIPTLLFIPLNETPQMTQGGNGKSRFKKDY
jgi:thioredoxin